MICICGTEIVPPRYAEVDSGYLFRCGSCGAEWVCYRCHDDDKGQTLTQWTLLDDNDGKSSKEDRRR